MPPLTSRPKQSSTRRVFMGMVGATLASPFLARTAVAAEGGRTLPIPELLDTRGIKTELAAVRSYTEILEGAKTPVLGYSRAYLGPTLKMHRGEVSSISVKNRLDQPITCHWHGLRVPAVLEGGPSLEIPPGRNWDVNLPVDQPAATLWYHSHVHRVTSEQVYYGLAGMVIVDDPQAPDEDLPSRYGVDDLPLIIQDRAFDKSGGFFYLKRGPVLTHGFRGNQILVNGAIRPEATVPTGLVRLRLLNASNARIYDLRFSDDRSFFQVSSDAGLLQRPLLRTHLQISPGERAEIVVDFNDARPTTLMSGPDLNQPLSGGMMREMSQLLPGDPQESAVGRLGDFDIVRFAPDTQILSHAGTLPTQFESAPAALSEDATRHRTFSLDMHRTGSGTGPATRTGDTLHQIQFMGINDTAFNHEAINIRMRIGEAEIWKIRSNTMAHPFHVHGVSFQVLSQNGKLVDFAAQGLKDVTLVRGETEILVRPNHLATDEVPYMYHCHILEHEDSGMMGRFAVE